MKNKIIFLIFFYSLFVNIIFSKKLILNDNSDKYISIKPEYPNVKNIGRFYIKENITYLEQSGSAIEFYLTSKSAEILLVGDGRSIYNDDFQRPRFAIYINDKLLLDNTMDEKEKKISLFNNEIEKEFKVKVILLSEAICGGIGIKNIKATISSSFFNSSNNQIIKQTEKKKLTIEYIGDSITCGFGNEAKSPMEFFQTKTENFEKTYAYLSAKELDFDYNVVCYSGCGLVSFDNTIYEKYTKINYFWTSKEYNEWDFQKYHNDIVIINLGTNDYGYIWGFLKDRYAHIYADFLGLVREKNPDAYIICIFGMMGFEDLFPLIEEAINYSGDNKIFGYLMPTQRIEDGIGAQYHPNEVSHAKWGKLLAKIIKEVIGYNYD